MVDKLAEDLNNLSRADAAYLDYAAVFNTVNHDLILNKLKNNFGIDANSSQNLKSYLQDRQQQVVISGPVSDSLPVFSGLPQGSILEPLLFAWFINDISERFSDGTELVMYADDTGIWREIVGDNDQFILQKDIDNFFNWSITNKMQLP